jgi:hypothetical protein
MFKEIRTTDAPEPLPPSRDLIKDAFVEMQRIQPEKTSESATTKKEALHTMNGRSYEMVDPEKVSGPYLTEEFETELFRRQGFSVDKIHMVEPPSSQYNPLGYALFGRGAITSKEAQKDAKEIFVCEQHLKSDHRKRIQAAIKHIAKKGDVVLVEGAESGVEVHRSEYPNIPGEICSLDGII